MKRVSMFFAVLGFVVLSINVNAQSKPGAAYFAGKWSVLLKGIPGGDTKMVFILENRNDSIVGVVQDTLGVEIAKIDKADLKDSEINIFFTTQGYDVNLVLTKKDEDHVTGSLMSMFEAEGERIKSVKLKESLK